MKGEVWRYVYCLAELKVESTGDLLKNLPQIANSEFRVDAKLQIQSSELMP